MFVAFALAAAFANLVLVYHTMTLKGFNMNAWENEPNEDAFEASGLSCIMKRDHNLVWTGHVGVPPSHALFRQRRDVLVEVPSDAVGLPVDVKRVCMADVHGIVPPAIKAGNLPLSVLVAVHGGLWSTGVRAENPELWFFGFQCGHAGDYRPADPSNQQARQNAATTERPYTPDNYRTYDYARKECEGLAAQLAALDGAKLAQGSA